MRQNTFLIVVMLVVMCVILVVMGAGVMQNHGLEERLIRQTGQMRELAEGTERLRAEIQRLRREVEAGSVRLAPPADSGPMADSGATQPAQTAAVSERVWLHPEVENYLQPEDYQLTLPDAATNGRLIRPYGTDPKGFNIIIENAADLQELIWYYVGVEPARRQGWTDPNRWGGMAAERIEITDDNKEFTIYLKRGIKWILPRNIDLDDPDYAWLRGDHYLTAGDVVFSLDILMHPQVENGFMKNYFEELDSWEAVDDHTVIVRWKKAQFGNVNQTLALFIIPEFFYAYDEDGTRFPDETMGLKFNQHWFNNKGLVGAGPYRMVSYEPGVEIRLERNEDFFGELPAIKEIVYPIYSDPDQTLLRLKAHTVQYGGLRASQYRDEIKQWQDKPESAPPADSHFFNGDIHHDLYLRFGYSYIGWNCDKPMFSDKRVRRAMTMALDRQGIIDNVYVGLGQIATGPFILGTPYNNPDVKAIPFDLDAAKALLKEAGWEDTDGDGMLDKDLNPDDGVERREPFDFKFLIYGSSPEYKSMATIFKEDLSKIGVRMVIDAAEWAQMQTKMNEKEFDAFTGGWLLDWEPDPFQLWHSSQADIPKGSNRVGFRNDEADPIIETLRVTFDAEERIRLLRRFHQILHDEQPYTFFRVPESVVCWWDEVQRFEFAMFRPITCSLPWWVE